MADYKKYTSFQRLDKVLNGENSIGAAPKISSYDFSNKNNNVIYRTNDKDDFEKTKLELQQNKYLKNSWKKANVDLSNTAINGLTNIKLMFRDADLMDAFPEIGAALDIIAEECSVVNDKGHIINVYSSSDRTKSVLEDLFVNRLNMQTVGPMVLRAMCKYGNQYMLLNIENKLGIKGWRQLPVYEVERYESGVESIWGNVNTSVAGSEEEDLSTKFVWTGHNTQIPLKNWQVGHFRLLTDSLYLPYGSSYLNKARRHFRMLSLMEDMMLIYRLERSIERRVFKVFVGNIDDNDIPAYIDQIANEFKRTPIVDPLTGQLDLRKNILNVSDDFFIPVRTENASNPIDTLPAAQNMTAMDDIKFVQNKVLTALGIPKTFLNFEESVGDGKNLALMDIRFTRRVNRIQQAFLEELTKIATIHLYLLGFHDELTNFSLTMNNPSSQAEMLELETMGKKVSIVKDAISDAGDGLSVMSLTKALKQIMKWSDNEIKENLMEMRLERALATELANTSQIIKRTGIFDEVDRIYGIPGAEYTDNNGEEGDNDSGGFGGGGGSGSFGGDFGGGLGDDMSSLGSEGGETDGEITGEEGEVPISDVGNEDNTNEMPEQPMESKRKRGQKVLVENKKPKINLKKRLVEQKETERIPILDKSFLINEAFNSMITQLNDFVEEKNNNKEL